MPSSGNEVNYDDRMINFAALICVKGKFDGAYARKRIWQGSIYNDKMIGRLTEKGGSEGSK